MYWCWVQLIGWCVLVFTHQQTSVVIGCRPIRFGIRILVVVYLIAGGKWWRVVCCNNTKRERAKACLMWKWRLHEYILRISHICTCKYFSLWNTNLIHISISITAVEFWSSCASSRIRGGQSSIPIAMTLANVTSVSSVCESNLTRLFIYLSSMDLGAFF